MPRPTSTQAQHWTILDAYLAHHASTVRQKCSLFFQTLLASTPPSLHPVLVRLALQSLCAGWTVDARSLVALHPVHTTVLYYYTTILCYTTIPLCYNSMLYNHTNYTTILQYDAPSPTLYYHPMRRALYVTTIPLDTPRRAAPL